MSGLILRLTTAYNLGYQRRAISNKVELIKFKIFTDNKLDSASDSFKEEIKKLDIKYSELGFLEKLAFNLGCVDEY